jgi:hypothetical protein
MFEMPAARPRRTLHVNPMMTSESDSADSTTTSNVTCHRRRIDVRKYVNGNATTIPTIAASSETLIENIARSTNRSEARRFQFSSSRAGS